MLITCPKCGNKISDTAITCIHCGELLSNYIKCPECKTLCRKSSALCVNCGYDFAKAAKEAEELKQKKEKERLSRSCSDCWNYDRERFSGCSIYTNVLFKPSAPNCKEYHYSTRAHEESHSCYLTTACVEYYGKPDDCYELQTLRNFRDNILKNTDEGKALCDEYYRIAPPIVDRLHELNDSANYEYIYSQILDCIKYIESKEYDKAVDIYKNMCIEMQKL